MTDEQRFLVDVGLTNIHFPVRVSSRSNPDGQHTIADISISARIWQRFEANWIDRVIQITHRHRDTIGPETLRRNIMDYYNELRAASVEVELSFPFFYEKRTPVSGEPCLVRYHCGHSAKITSIERGPRSRQRLRIPVITTYPGSQPAAARGLFAQLTVVTCEIETDSTPVYPEEIIDIVERQALSPVFSFLTPEDQAAIIEKVHSEQKTSVVLTDEVKTALQRHPAIKWYQVRSSNHGMLHSYSTFVGTEKSSWAPFADVKEPEAARP